MSNFPGGAPQAWLPSLQNLEPQALSSPALWRRLLVCFIIYLFVFNTSTGHSATPPCSQMTHLTSMTKNPVGPLWTESNPPGPLQSNLFSYLLICFCGIPKPYGEVHKKYKYTSKWVITKRALLDIFSHSVAPFLSSFLYLAISLDETSS